MDSSGQEPEPWNWEDSLKTAIQCGVSISEFNEMTPYELNLIVEVESERINSDTDEKLILVWLSEYWHRQKKLPPLKKALEEIKGKDNLKMTDDEMFEMVKKLNAQFGGAVIKDDGNEREESETDSI